MRVLGRDVMVSILLVSRIPSGYRAGRIRYVRPGCVLNSTRPGPGELIRILSPSDVTTTGAPARTRHVPPSVDRTDRLPEPSVRPFQSDLEPAAGAQAPDLSLVPGRGKGREQVKLALVGLEEHLGDGRGHPERAVHLQGVGADREQAVVV